MFPRIRLQADYPSTLAIPWTFESYPVPPLCKCSAHIVRRQAAGLLFFLTLVAGCSSKTLEATPPTIESARPAQSPPLAQRPAGAVRPLAGHPQAAIFDARTAQLVILTSGSTASAPASITVMGSQQTPSRVIDLPGPATGLTGDGGGNAYLSTRGGYFVVDLSAGRVARAPVSGAETVDFTAITRRADGAVALGTADGSVYALTAGTLRNRLKIFAHVDALAAQGNTLAILDRGQTSITTIGVDGKVGQQLRAGQGATTMVADPAGRLLVTDTRGGQLLVFGVDPLILRQAYPVRQSPYGVAGSRGLTWVSQTSANLVIGYDLSTGIPLEKVRYPSVRQPNTLAFDDGAGTLYVVSGAGGGVQVIEHAAAGPR
jgi:outer membrane protein assembly factor BamB